MPGACSVGGAAAAEECWKPSDRTKGGLENRAGIHDHEDVCN